ncbi:MAG: hypothetical protein ACRCXB_33665 [Aeromonadaceae bacterium]
MSETKLETEISFISYRLTSIPLGEEMKYLTEIEGDIHSCDDGGNEYFTGKVKYYIIDADEAMEEGGSPESVLDLLSNTAHFMGDIYDRNGCFFKRKIRNLFDTETFSSNFLILDRVEILPLFRGKCFFSTILDDGIRHFGKNAELVALKAFPLQFEAAYKDEATIKWHEKMEISKLTLQEKTAFKKLERYYKKFGFVKVSDTGTMVKPLEYS